jgi:hypothetical protein
VSFCAAAKTSAEGSGMRDVAAYSIASGRSCMTSSSHRGT